MIKKNKFSIIVALVILYLSLASSNTFDKVPVFNIPYFDKLVHFLMYFGLMSVIILENRKDLASFRSLLYTATIPLLYGIIIEVLQGTLTATRSASFYDAVFDLAGIIFSVLLWLSLKNTITRSIK